MVLSMFKREYLDADESKVNLSISMVDALDNYVLMQGILQNVLVPLQCWDASCLLRLPVPDGHSSTSICHCQPWLHSMKLYNLDLQPF